MLKKILFVLLLVAITYAVSSDPDCGGFDNGYFFDGQKCENCLNSRCSCSIFNTCTKCSSQYVFNQLNNTCTYCNSRVMECCLVEGGYAVRATKCTEGNQLYGSICIGTSYCGGYNDYGICINCQLGYFLVNDQQTPYCKSCGSDINYCSQCQGPNSCSKCRDNYYLTKDNNNAYKCDKCSDNCICSDSTALCTGCVSTSYYKDQDACKLCSSTYDNCLTCTSTQCNTCYSNYAYDATNKKCIACPSHCSECTFDSTSSKTSCTSTGCDIGYYVSNNAGINECQTCTDANAYKCKDSTTTTQCKASGGSQYDYYPHPSAYYLITVASKLTCVKNDKKCMKMRTPVDTAELQGQCESCYPEYTLTAVKNCKICSTEIPGCTKCTIVTDTDNLECSTCLSGTEGTNYFPSDKKCSPCTVGCKTCTDQNTCGSCIMGYYLDSGKCTQCIEKCIQCQSTTTCERCQLGFRVNSGGSSTLCESCPLNCLQCDSQRQTCTACSSTHYLNMGTCFPKDPYCALYNTNGSCKTCHYGQRLVGGKCLACGQSSSGYINCPQQCTASKYMRDGDQLTQTLNAGVNSSVHQTMSLFIVLIITFIICGLF